jgi:hypothetical protein
VSNLAYGDGMSSRSHSLFRGTVKVVIVIAAVQAAAIVAGRIAARRVDTGDAESDELRRLAVLNGVNLAITSQSFRHARFDLGMGGVNIDLTTAQLSPAGAEIEVYGAMGGLNLTVPAQWRVTADADDPRVGIKMPEQIDLPDDAPHLHVASHGKMLGVNVATA